MTTTLHVRAKAGNYDVVFEDDLLKTVGSRLKQLNVNPSSSVVIITDTTVEGLYADVVATSCRQAGFSAHVISVPPRDESKSLAVAEQIYNQLIDLGVRRDGVVLALGGGVVGDLAGFVAATYQRGIRFFQLPTTLLAHDSSIGGKVGVNLPRGKNLIGAFYPPQAVWFDVSTLASLPVREWQGGMAEVIKHAIICDVDLFTSLELNPVKEFPGAHTAERIVGRGSAVKVRIVNEDEHESELRMVLNLGHTVGHAVELESHYGLNHGEAVAIGMRFEAEIAYDLGMLDAVSLQRIIHILEAHGLPVLPPNHMDLSNVLRALSVDKKHQSTHWTFVLPREIGQVEIVSDVEQRHVEKVWERLMGGPNQ